MTDLLKAFEKCAKGVRAAVENLAFLIRGPECGCGKPGCEGFSDPSPYIRCDLPHPDYQNPCCRLLGHDGWHAGLDGSCWINDPAAGSPENAAVVAPSPKQGSDSGPADSDIPPLSPAGPHPVEASAWTNEGIPEGVEKLRAQAVAYAARIAVPPLNYHPQMITEMDSRKCVRCGHRRQSHPTGAGLCVCESPSPAAPSGGTQTYEITLHHTQLIPGSLGAMYGYSDDFPGKQFLIIPQDPK